MKNGFLLSLRRTYLGNCALLLASNYATKVRSLTGMAASGHGSTHARLTKEQSLEYIERVFREYKEVAGIDRFGGRIAEVGPGDNCGVAMLMRADGCESVDLVDRFYSRRDETQQSEIYRGLMRKYPQMKAVIGQHCSESEFTGISRRYGSKASAEEFFAANTGYDFIVSRAVMEHVTDCRLSLRRMASALKPAGMLLHAVDLRDHGLFSNFGFHEMKFYEVPSWAYGAMIKDCGRPNRVPLSEYRDILSGCGLEFYVKVTSLVGHVPFEHPLFYEEIPTEERKKAIDLVHKWRPAFARGFGKEKDEDLSISSFFIAARKPK